MGTSPFSPSWTGGGVREGETIAVHMACTTVVPNNAVNITPEGVVSPLPAPGTQDAIGVTGPLDDPAGRVGQGNQEHEDEDGHGDHLRSTPSRSEGTALIVASRSGALKRPAMNPALRI
jgi:hypothetical protein